MYATVWADHWRQAGPDRGVRAHLRSGMAEELGQHQGVGRVSNVTLLGYDGELRWGQDTEEKGALRVVLPPTRPCDYAWALRVRFS